ncbi:hypothetical protein LINPERPRIM_LOCUS31449, partial [Linum perenne]
HFCPELYKVNKSHPRPHLSQLSQLGTEPAFSHPISITAHIVL